MEFPQYLFIKKETLHSKISEKHVWVIVAKFAWTVIESRQNLENER